MKATELMIGDWYFWEAEGKKYYYQVVRTTFSADDTTIGNFEPVPLTAEILHKNGWMQNGMTQKAIMECDGENCDDTWCEMTYDGELNCYFDYPEDAVLFTCDRGCDFLKIHFVHELQHALRLCGLNELADNFQIQ